ncbi:MAG: 2'-5' RNA ligase, partial [Proteobacteria bacterium]
MTEFSTYEKMPTNLKKLGLSEDEVYQMGKLKWVVTEKVHGANFSFVYEDGRLRFAKRKEYLQWGDDFFGFQLVVKNLEANVIQFFEELASQVKATKYVLYGELFGGEYPHATIERIKNLQAIQTGVYYCPDIRFCAFDIAIETDGLSSKYYLDYETAITYFEKFNIFYAKPMLIGKLADALNFNTRINSGIPAAFHLPPLEKNLIEGIVVKPYDVIDRDLLASRPIIKIKNAEFDEEEKYHEAEKWSFIPGVSSRTEELSFVVDELRHYVNQNRLNSAVSKIGAFERGNEARISEIKAEVLADVITDFNGKNNNFFDELDPGARQWIIERIRSEINMLVIR